MRRGGIILTVVLALLSIVIGAGIRYYTLVNASPKTIKETINFDHKHGTLNILVLGIDQVEAVNRSDTIILARIDIDRKTASVMSIPRDTRVAIKGYGYQKVNHAYAYGGISLLKDTIVNLTGVPVNYYLTLNYSTFPKVIDAVGGVDVYIEKSMKYIDNAQNLYIDFSPGRYHMNGEDALKYVRYRMDAMGDIGRMKRQQDFAKTFLKKVFSPAILPRIPELIELIMSEIKTDIPVKAALQLAGQLKDMQLKNIRFFTMPGQPANIEQISYFIPDLQRASEEMDPNWIPPERNSVLVAEEAAPEKKESVAHGAPQSSEPSENLKSIVSKFTEPIAVLNGTGRQGLAKRFTTLFEKAGIEVEFTGNAKHSDYHYCFVQYPDDGNDAIAKELAHLCGIPDNLVRKGDVTYAAALVLGKNNSDQIMSRITKIFDGQ